MRGERKITNYILIFCPRESINYFVMTASPTQSVHLLERKAKKISKNKSKARHFTASSSSILIDYLISINENLINHKPIHKVGPITNLFNNDHFNFHFWYIYIYINNRVTWRIITIIFYFCLSASLQLPLNWAAI